VAGESRFPKSIKYIIGNEACERFSFYGMSTILVPYMQANLHWDQPHAEAVYHDFVAAAYAATVVGGWISDRFFGRYKTILWLSYGYVLGHAILAGADLAPSLAVLCLYLGLTFVVAGQAGIKPNLSAFVGDQFTQDQAGLLDRVYSIFYIAINVGSAFSQVATPWLLAGCGGLCPGSGVAWGFGVPGILMFLSLLIYLAGRKTYVRVPPAGRERNGFAATLWTRLTSGEGAARQEHGAEAVEGVKSVLQIMLVFVPIITFWALYFQYGSSWFNQAEAMNRDVFGWHMEAAQMEALNAVLILVMVPLFSYVVYPALERAGIRMTLLRRMTWGMIIAIPSFLSAAMIQNWIEHGAHPHIGWQVIQYVIISISETMVSVTALEFAYTQAPKSMKGAIMSLWFLTIGLGSFVTGVVTRHVDFATRTNYFLFWAGFMTAGAILFALMAWLYKPVKFVAANQAA
jgi:POT family proton-dependent oligopeptide transporter